MISLSSLLAAKLALCHLSSYAVCQSVAFSQSQVLMKITLHIRGKGTKCEGARWARALTCLNAALVPTLEPVLLFSICEIK